MVTTESRVVWGTASEKNGPRFAACRNYFKSTSNADFEFCWKDGLGRFKNVNRKGQRLKNEPIPKLCLWSKIRKNRTCCPKKTGLPKTDRRHPFALHAARGPLASLFIFFHKPASYIENKNEVFLWQQTSWLALVAQGCWSSSWTVTLLDVHAQGDFWFQPEVMVSDR